MDDGAASPIRLSHPTQRAAFVIEVAYLAIALATAFGLAVLAGRWLRGPFGYIVAAASSCGFICCPLLIPSHAVVCRAIVAFACAELFFKAPPCRSLGKADPLRRSHRVVNVRRLCT